MKKARLHRSHNVQMLATSFVVTFGAVESSGCKKQPVDGGSSSSLYRSPNGECFVSHSMTCPKGVMCNPPPPTQIDCPPKLLDGGVSDASTRRPPGKESWLRTTPRLWVLGTPAKPACSYEPERFCSPDDPNECTGYAVIVGVPCTVDVNAGTSVRIEPFVYTDGLGVCRRIATASCSTNGRCTDLPDGDVVPCPGTAAPRGT